MNGRRILVTGALGLLGRALVSRLTAAGDDVIALVRPNSLGLLPVSVQGVEIDLRSFQPDALAGLGKLDGVIHLAQSAGWHDFPAAAAATTAVNVAATIALAEAATAAGATRFVYASSGGIYGPSSEPIIETAPLKPSADLGFYLSSKIAAESLLAFFTSRLLVQILRPFFIYGPGQKESFLIPRLVQSVGAGKPIKVAGGRGPQLNPIWVDDAAAAFESALDLTKSVTVNVAGPQVVSLRQIADCLGLYARRQPVFEETGDPPADYVADTSLMAMTVGTPNMLPQAGLGRLFDVK